MRAKRFRLLLAWSGLGGVLMALAAGLAVASPVFSWERQLADMPALPLAGGMFAAGLAYLLVVPLVRATIAADRQPRRDLAGAPARARQQQARSWVSAQKFAAASPCPNRL